MGTARVTMPIIGLGCGGDGALRIERLLLSTPGVTSAYVNPLTEMAYINFDSVRVPASDLAGVIRRAGYRTEGYSLR
jgi:copper chaperone CopZ